MNLTRLACLFGAALVCLHAPPALGADDPPALLSVDRIWDQAPHNAFTSLVRYHDRFVCAFREASEHKGGTRDSRIRVLASADATAWTGASILADPRGDIRDAKLSITPDGKLMLLTAIQLYDSSVDHHQSLAWFTTDLVKWEGPYDVGEPDIWLWGIAWRKGSGYSIGYGTGPDRFVRLYKTSNGKDFASLVKKLAIPAAYPNENAIVFDASGAAHALVRCESENAYIGSATAPYTEWTWKQSNARVGGPAITQAPDGRWLGAGRLYDGKVRTSLFWIDFDAAKISEALALPSGGDTSYPGLVWDKGELLVSYYSSHEGKANIYLARVAAK